MLKIIKIYRIVSGNLKIFTNQLFKITVNISNVYDNPPMKLMGTFLFIGVWDLGGLYFMLRMLRCVCIEDSSEESSLGSFLNFRC